MAASGSLGGPVLKDVVAYVEVWSANGTENYSKTFRNQLVDMGAKVSKTFNKQVTHVVFKDGYQSTWEKAQERGVKLVSVLWVEKCRVAGVHIDESLFPAANTNQHIPSLLKKKRKCMQPKDFIPKTPESDKRLQRKFEKMAKELQQQKTTLGTNVPVLLFESNGSLVYSPTGKVYRGHHSAMKKRLQEMKEKRENLSPTSSQMIEQPDYNTVNSLREASLNLSHDTLCSDDSFAGGLPVSVNDLCGGSACGSQERNLGEFVADREGGVCAVSPVLQAGGIGPSAAPCPQGLSTPCGSTSSHPTAETPQQSGAAGGIVTPVSKPSQPVTQGPSDGKRHLSPVSSATKGRPGGCAQPMGSSTKRKKTPENFCPASKERRKRRRSLRQRPAPRLRLWEAESGLRSVRRPAVKSLALEESSFDDYFSPDNLKERVSEGLLGDQLPSSPAPLRCQRSLSKTERTSLLDRADLSLIGRSPRPTVSTCSTVKPGPRLERPVLSGADAGLGGRNSGGMPAADGTPRPCPWAEAQGGGDARPSGGDAPHAPSGLVPWTGPQGDPSPLKGSREETEEWTDTQGMQKEGTSPETTESAEAHSEGKLNAVGDCAEERSTEEREAPAQGSSESVKSGPTRPSVVAGSRKGLQDLLRPQEESRERGQKPTRTLVMTSMPSEKYSVVIQVVNRLKGFSLAPQVCGSTTHVLAGRPRRTLNVLLGMARGCWILSFEWVLWSLEMGHWISEEPFELSNYFPAAPLCRQERLLSAGQYRGTLFADQPTMFISPASNPPRAKLGELVVLCGGRVTQVPRQASIFIGPFPGRKKETVKYLSETWILDSISQHKVCASENHLLP
ncbi:microcephalin isoform X1 [Moschus berezovskii]|uniref:microcephalin isoform X1 n=2 Tax=Moschus berezovskii TaxID=68408 RepID=UPI002444E401|nr:microcephalin isoform X1 [Moschus berezovskii]